jgi:hypothetical protein
MYSNLSVEHFCRFIGKQLLMGGLLMERGFFVVFKRNKKSTATTPVNWKSDLIEPIRGWSPTTGSSVDEAIERQQLQYAERILAKEPVPDLFLLKDFPMASGQMIRFVPIAP